MTEAWLADRGRLFSARAHFQVRLQPLNRLLPSRLRSPAMPAAKAFAAQSAEAHLEPFSFERRELRANDVAIDILYCGVCHSDLHTVRSEWPGTVYPCVPGHEIVGRVTAVGPEV